MLKILCLLLICFVHSAQAQMSDQLANRVFGAVSTEKFSFHETTYFIFGEDDLKLQYSFKYRLSKSYNLYLAYTQLMFWSVYDESKPFKDVNYRPELFYRVLDTETKFIKSIDVGYWHLSNGQKEADSRSLDELFIRATFLTKLNRNTIGSVLKIHTIYNEDKTNKDIVDHLGYWHLNAFITDIVTMWDNRVDFTMRTYAGSKVYDFDQGGIELGATYNFIDSDFNPALYLQWFEGYAENLLEYNKKHTEIRLGFLLSF